MQKKQLFLFILAGLFLPSILFSQHHDHAALTSSESAIVSEVEPQPLLAQAIRLEEALSFLGSPLSLEDAKRLEALQNKPLTPIITKLIQEN